MVAGARAMMKYRQRSKTSGNGAESGSNGGGSGAAKSWGYANANTNGINAPPAGVPLPASGPPPRDFGVSLLGAKGAYGASGTKPAAAYATPPSSSGALPRKVRAASPQFSVSSTHKRTIKPPLFVHWNCISFELSSLAQGTPRTALPCSPPPQLQVLRDGRVAAVQLVEEWVLMWVSVSAQGPWTRVVGRGALGLGSVAAGGALVSATPAVETIPIFRPRAPKAAAALRPLRVLPQ